MNTKLKLALGGLAFVLLLAASTKLYQSLSKDYTPQDILSPGSANTKGTKTAGEKAAASSDSENTDSSANTPESEEPEKITAPDFSVMDAEGNSVKLSDFYGRPVVLNFWASWCPPCKAEMPEFETVFKELGKDTAFLMINATDGSRETEDTAKAFMEEQDYSFPVYYDVNQEAAYAYGISSLPTTVFIDAEGYLITGAVGKINEDTLRNGIAMITAAE